MQLMPVIKVTLTHALLDRHEHPDHTGYVVFGLVDVELRRPERRTIPADRVKTRDAMSFSACAVVAMETLVVGSCSCDNPFLTGSDRLFEGKDTAFRVAELPLKP
jgi:hypothetical protein